MLVVELVLLMLVMMMIMMIMKVLLLLLVMMLLMIIMMMMIMLMNDDMMMLVVEVMLLPSSIFFLCLPLPTFGGTSLFTSIAEVRTPVFDAIKTLELLSPTELVLRIREATDALSLADSSPCLFSGVLFPDFAVFALFDLTF